MLAGLRDDPEGPQVDLLRDLFPHLGPGVLQATDCREHVSDGKKMLAARCYYCSVEITTPWQRP